MTNEQYEAMEAEIARLQNENYNSSEARLLMDLESELILAAYRGEIVDGIVVENSLWLDE